MSESKTQLGSAVAPVDLTCPTCRVPTGGRPFCAQDGHLVRRPFVVGERYVMDSLLGAGATALVFGGHDKLLGTPIALKVLRPSAARDPNEAHRFLRAARLSSQLHHENIAAVHECGEDPDLGIAFLVMERLVGGTLAELRSQSTRLAWPRAVRILLQICRALSESHELGILHRDLTLRNVMLTSVSGRIDVVKLCDFGLACSSTGDDRVTSTGTAVGTPAYMAPEQVRGDEGLDHRADLYSLGVIAYELISGRLPHESPTAVAMIASKLTMPPTPISERCAGLALPPGLEPLIMRCLDPSPSARPESAAVIERELRELLEPDPATAPTQSIVIGQRVGGYRVVERLNQGGMGEVYVVEHDVIGTRAALKVLLPEIASIPEAVDRFVQEARASGKIGHPNIARCYDFGFLPDQRAYVLMELIEGESVATRIALRGPLPLAEVRQILLQTGDALAAAHDHGIIHRDIKPDHIMLVRQGDGFQVKLLDFGIAKVYAPDATKTQIGVFMGTPLYCAPEQVLGEPVSPASDIYSLGATMYEMVTGRPPFSGEPGHVLALKTQRDPTPIDRLRPGLPRAVVATIERMMARDRAQRPRSMRAIANEVASWPKLGGDGGVATKVRRPGGRPRWIIGACVAACVVVGTAVAVWPRSDATPAVDRPSDRAPGEPMTPTITPPITPAITPTIAPTIAPTITPIAPVDDASHPPTAVKPRTPIRPSAATPRPGKAATGSGSKTKPTVKPTSTPRDGSGVLIVDPYK